MGRKNHSKSEKKRKHSSDNSTSGHSKNPRNGGSPKQNSEDLNVSSTLHKANSILYDEQCPELNLSVFSANDTSDPDPDHTVIKSVNRETDKMADGERGSEHDQVSKTSNEDILTYLKQLDAKITRVDKRLNTLESLEEKVSKFEKDLNKLWGFMSDQIKTVNEKVAESILRTDNLEFSIGEAADDIQRMQRERAQMQDDLLYIQSQSMRNNLVFGNILEEINETNEKTECKIRSFMKDSLQMTQENVDQISFERVHRMGPRPAGNRPRKIVAKFTYFKDREQVRRQRKQLEGSTFFMHEQYPREIVERRKSLMPRLKAAKREGRNAWLSYDTLYIDGAPVNANRG